MIYYVLSIVGWIGMFLIYNSVPTSIRINLLLPAVFITHIVALSSVAGTLQLEGYLADMIISLIIAWVLSYPPKGNLFKIIAGILIIVGSVLFLGLYLLPNFINLPGGHFYWALWIVAAFFILGMKLIFDGYKEK